MARSGANCRVNSWAALLFLRKFLQIGAAWSRRAAALWFCNQVCSVKKYTFFKVQRWSAVALGFQRWIQPIRLFRLLQGLRAYASYRERVFWEIVSFRSGPFGFGSSANCGFFLITQEVGGQAAQDCHVVLRMAWANAAVVRAQGDIRDRVFDVPGGGRGSQKQFGIGRQAGDEVARRKRGAVWQLPFRFDHDIDF